MALPRFQESPVTTQTGAGITQQAQARTLQTLTGVLTDWQDRIYQERMAKAIDAGEVAASESFSKEGMEAERLDMDTTFYGQSYNKTLDSYYTSSLYNDIRSTASDLSSQFEYDPAGFTTAFQSYKKETLNDIDPRYQALAKLELDAQEKANFRAVRKRHDEWLLKETTSSYMEMLDGITEDSADAAFNGDTDIMLQKRELYEMTVNNALEQKAITPEQARKMKEYYVDNSDTQAILGGFKRLIDADIESAGQMLEDFEAEAPGGISQTAWEKSKSAMRSMLNSELKAIKAGDELNTANANIMVSDATKVFDAGKIPRDMDNVESLLYFASETKQHEYQVSKAAYNITQKYSQYSLPEQMALINQVVQQKDASRVDVEALAKAKSNLKAKMALAEKDPISLAVQDGIIEQTNIMTPTDMNSVMSVLPTRASQAQVASGEYGVQPKLFMNAEVQQFTNWLNNPQTSISEKIQFIEAIEQSAPYASMAVYNQLMEKGNYVFASASDAINDGDRIRAEYILRGQMIQREMGSQIDYSILDMKIQKGFGNAFMEAGEGTRRKALEGVRAYFVAVAEERGKGLEFGTGTNAREAIEKVAGKKGTRNGMDFFAPIGKDPDTINDYFDNLKNDDIPDIQGIDSANKSDLLKRSKMVHVGDGKFRFIWGIGEKKRYIALPDGSPLELEYK